MTRADAAMDAVLACVLPILAFRVVATSDLPKAIVLFVAFGLLSALSWARLDAPDVALVEAAVGAGLTGALLMTALGWAGQGRAPREVSRLRRALVAVLLAAVAITVGAATWSLGHPSDGLRDEVLGGLHPDGVSHPVTAVLLDYRAYDTLLEVMVLLVAAVAARSQLDRTRPHGGAEPPEPLLDVLVRMLSPGIVLVAGYLLWRGAHAPGGAFQAGAILAGGGILANLAGKLRPPALRSRAAMAALAAGPAFFLAVGLAPLAFGKSFLEYPRAWAGALIFSIESLLTLSIAVALTMFFPGGANGGSLAGRAETEDPA